MPLLLLLVFMCVAEVGQDSTGTGTDRRFACGFAIPKNSFYPPLVSAGTDRNTYVNIRIRSYNRLIYYTDVEPKIQFIFMRQVSELTISYKPKVKAADRYIIRFSKDAYDMLLKEAFDSQTLEYKEYFKLVLLNRANKVLGITTISEGGMDGTVVDVRLILQTALLVHSSKIIIAHNHPGGALFPSKHDDAITKKIKEAANVLDITLLDHIIVTGEGFYSYADEGKL